MTWTNGVLFGIFLIFGGWFVLLNLPSFKERFDLPRNWILVMIIAFFGSFFTIMLITLITGFFYSLIMITRSFGG